MDLHIWHSKLAKLWKERNGYLVLAAGLLLTNFFQLLVVVHLSGQWRTILVPANLSQTVWLNQSTVSESFLSEMTYYFSKLILDVTPESAPLQREALLHYVSPKHYGELKNQLIANEERIKGQAISTSFYPVDIKIDAKELVAVITGDLKTSVGQEVTSTVRESYLAKYDYHQGRLLLKQFNEVKNDNEIN